MNESSKDPINNNKKALKISQNDEQWGTNTNKPVIFLSDKFERYLQQKGSN